MRQYQSIWVQIKKDGHCTVAVHPKLHKRVVKAVRKEKWKDIAYKVEWDIAGYMPPELLATGDDSNPNLLHFKLIKQITVSEL